MIGTGRSKRIYPLVQTDRAGSDQSALNSNCAKLLLAKRKGTKKAKDANDSDFENMVRRPQSSVLKKAYWALGK
jgi:hypothetical protein